jgi:Peptidase family M23
MARPTRDGCTGPYQWPVKPFGKPHPVRGNFGDPRTRFAEPRSDGALEGDGVFSFHQGFDINAPDGSPVYPVASGKVTRVPGERVTVACGNGRSFQYWHIVPAVRVGQRVEAGKTVLGHILPLREHVHLTHLENGKAVNPLAPGHLTPYRDTTLPKVLRLGVRSVRGRDEPARHLSGRMFFVAEAVDTPALAVQGRWHRGYPVSPALITWRIERASRVVVPERVAWNVRRSVPKNERFWVAFARGTYQNWPVFESHHYRFERGKYLFKLSPRPFDTRKLADGVYELVVTAEDTGGNRGLRRLRFTVDNASI